jgi:hypothetical protein
VKARLLVEAATATADFPAFRIHRADLLMAAEHDVR